MKFLKNPLIQSVLTIYDGYQNSNGDTLDTATMLIPFMHPGYPWSAWGAADISNLVIAVKIVGLLAAAGVAAILAFKR